MSQLVSVSNKGNLYQINYRREIEDNYPVFLLKNSSAHKDEHFFVIKSKQQKNQKEQVLACVN